ncbi:sigma-54-dependent transcriptional regulator [Chitinophaga japonensis]|uniref:DNA-binding NtrC family response regulator n=1 Tax=Chitinophaga japonensis TaxID=104662 RepID=A0A562T1J4_CHIJA|nr:sigma-54 dependent transcriptional regulator [Chitinophaga japonensis]TWI86750.1 DNA-binding NtrC family response regulator [Chitinophaga japonensis]
MSGKEKILIVEDEFIVANDLRIMLAKGGYSVCGIAASAEQARALIAQKQPDWVLLDIMLKTATTGIELARELLHARIPFLYISANTNQRTLEAARATQPYGFLVKPFRERDLFVMLDIARYRYGVETGMIRPEVFEEPAANGIDPDIVGESTPIEDAIRKVRVVAPTATSVLLLGESGTGKERFAHAVHRLSARRNKPFVTVNCAALPVSLLESELFGHERGAFTGANQRRIGKFELAHGGTLFLDEIGELPLEAQVKLLRVLQEKEIERLGGDRPISVDVRVIAATNRNLEQEVAEQRFRLDLYYRLNVFPVELPPLRERKEDIGILANYFLRKFETSLGRKGLKMSSGALRLLEQYDWPGNIRELEHMIERQILLTPGDEITEIALPATGNQPDTVGGPLLTLEEMERMHIMKALKTSNGRVSGKGGAAELLDIPAQTLYSKMKKLGIRSGYQ